MTATTPASRKAKGRKFQQAIRDDLVDRLGIAPGDVLSTPMGQTGCDIYLSPKARERFPFGVECKHQETLSIPVWWRQCRSNAEAEGLAPLLVFRRSREEPLAVLRWSDLLVVIALGRFCGYILAGDLPGTLDTQANMPEGPGDERP